MWHWEEVTVAHIPIDIIGTRCNSYTTVIGRTDHTAQAILLGPVICVLDSHESEVYY